MIEIKVRKPKVIKYFGIAEVYARYSNRQYKWLQSLPKNGDKIKITWLPSCINVANGTPNPYIGMEGVVTDMDINGSFSLRCDGCWLINISGNYNYIKLNSD